MIEWLEGLPIELAQIASLYHKSVPMHTRRYTGTATVEVIGETHHVTIILADGSSQTRIFHQRHLAVAEFERLKRLRHAL